MKKFLLLSLILSSNIVFCPGEGAAYMGLHLRDRSERTNINAREQKQEQQQKEEQENWFSKHIRNISNKVSNLLSKKSADSGYQSIDANKDFVWMEDNPYDDPIKQNTQEEPKVIEEEMKEAREEENKKRKVTFSEDTLPQITFNPLDVDTWDFNKLKKITVEDIKNLPLEQVEKLLNKPVYLSKLSQNQVRAINPELFSKVLQNKLSQPLTSEFVKKLSTEQIQKLLGDHTGLRWKNWFTSFKDNFTADAFDYMQKHIQEVKRKNAPSISIVDTIKLIFKSTKNIPKNSGESVDSNPISATQKIDDENKVANILKSFDGESINTKDLAQLTQATQKLSEESGSKLLEIFKQKQDNVRQNFYDQFKNIDNLSSDAARQVKTNLLIQARNTILVAMPKAYEEVELALGITTKEQIGNVNNLVRTIQKMEPTESIDDLRLNKAFLDEVDLDFMIQRMQDFQEVSLIASKLDPANFLKGVYGVKCYDSKGELINLGTNLLKDTEKLVSDNIQRLSQNFKSIVTLLTKEKETFTANPMKKLAYELVKNINFEKDGFDELQKRAQNYDDKEMKELEEYYTEALLKRLLILSPNQIGKINLEFIQTIPGTMLNELSADQIQALNKNQITKLTEGQVEKLSIDFLKKLKPDQRTWFTPNQRNFFDEKRLNAFNLLNKTNFKI